MTSANRLPSRNVSGQPWVPGAPAQGVTCPACGLANEPGARTCRNCGLPIAAAEDPLRGVAPGRVDLPKVQRSGVSATVGFVLVVALLLVGGSLAFNGGGGLLSGGGRFFGAAASPSPTPGPGTQTGTGQTGTDDTGTETAEPTPKAKGTKFDYTCDADAIKDLSRGEWFLVDVQDRTRTAEDGSLYDQVYWRLQRTSTKKVKTGTAVTMQWSTPQKLQDRFGITGVGGDRAILVTFDGPVSLQTGDQNIERDQLDSDGIDQVQRVQLFERNGKVRTVLGLDEDSCARMRSNGWAKKANQQAARIVLDLERVYEGS